MYFFLTKETLEAILLKFGFDITGLTLFESTVIFLIGNLFYLLTLMFFFSILFKILTRFKRWLF